MRAALCKFECGLGNPPTGRFSDPANSKRNTGRWHEFSGPQMHVAIRIKPLEVLTHNDHVGWLNSRRIDPCPNPCRADIGIKIKLPTQDPGRVQAALFSRRIRVVRHWSKQDTVSRLRRADHRIGNGRTFAFQRRKPYLHSLHGNGPRQARPDRIKDIQRHAHDLWPDPVTLKGEQCQVRGHGRST